MNFNKLLEIVYIFPKRYKQRNMLKIANKKKKTQKMEIQKIYT